MHCTELGLRPNWISPPGETISDILHERSVSVAQFARSLGATFELVNDLLSGHVPIDSALAERLEIVLGAPKTFWESREAQYRQDLMRLHGHEDSAEEVNQWLKDFPLKDMVNFGWIPECADQSEYADECLRFFDTPTVKAWRTAYDSSLKNVAFRTSPTFDSHEAAAAAWLRQGEREASDLVCNTWDADAFKKQLTPIRSLTRKNNPQEFLPELQRLCADCGVAVVIVRAPTGCRASGATKFLSSTKALLMLSFRYLSDDHFWFTFFHEAAHLLLHRMEMVFLEGKETCFTKEEQEANHFASTVLVPPEFEQEMCSLPHEARAIMRFARKIGISPGIVVGQLQFRKILQHSQMSRLKNRFRWV